MRYNRKMTYLIRFRLGKPHLVAHHLHNVSGVAGAFCSQTLMPGVGHPAKSGTWEIAESLPPQVRVCRVCERLKHKLDNPLPARVERELELLARWDTRAAALQRKKMLTYYRNKQLNRTPRRR
jgi:hypothetical protein